jgi:hypothetical protein
LCLSRDLGNWRGVVLLDAASEIMPLVVSSQQPLVELINQMSIGDQNGICSGSIYLT